MEEQVKHLPVLLDEVLRLLKPGPGSRWLDGTVGAGGHASALLEASGPDGTLLGLDKDPVALGLAGDRLKKFAGRFELRRGSFENLKELAPGKYDGILLDLGVSSMQFDTAERGFSFRFDAPLDMRMDPGQALTAAGFINQADEKLLADTLFRLGEEPKARRLTRVILKARPLFRTLELARLIEGALGGRRDSKIHPATRTFQALRLVVNRELPALEAVLPQACELLAPGGRLAVISFHSLEDRRVKEWMKRESTDCLCDPGIPLCQCGHKAVVKKVTRKPVVAGDAEVYANPRSRSAKLRVVEKI